jgi:hypothetical protein
MASVVGKHWRELGKRITGSATCLALLLGLLGCSQQSSPISMADNALKGVLAQQTNIEEVSSPVEIQQLRRSLSSQAPQVKIVGLKPDATIEQTTASIRFEVDDFPIFQDPELALGPHLTVLLDDQPYADVYDAKQSITFTDLKAGTHRVQVFASTPWNESLKTPGAFDQLSFNVFAPTQANRGAADQPRLIYSQPQGEYGAEPILLDYILTPTLAQTQPNMKVQVTVNGNSFVTEEQPPIYLTGFKSGTNWVKVEVLGSNGRAIAPPSEIIQLVTLKTGGTDTLSKLTRGDLDAKDAAQIISLAASQRRAAQKREALSEPKPTPTPQPIEKKVEDTAEVLLPAKSAVKPIPVKASVSQPAVMAAPQPVKQNVPTALPIPEKTAIEKPADAETFPAIAWKKFLKFKAGADRTPSSLSNPANQKSLPSPQVKTTEPKTEPSEVSISTPASNSEAATSKP